MIKKLVRAIPMLFDKVADNVLVDCLLRQYRSSYKVIPAFDSKFSSLIHPSLCAVASLISVKTGIALVITFDTKCLVDCVCRPYFSLHHVLLLYRSM